MGTVKAVVVPSPPLPDRFGPGISRKSPGFCLIYVEFCSKTGDLMTELLRFSVSGNQSVLVEIPSPEGGLTPAGGKRNRILEATSSFSDHLDAIGDAMKETLDKFREMNPDEAKISFGISFTAEAGAVIARTALGANLGVELTWRRTDEG